MNLSKSKVNNENFVRGDEKKSDYSMESKIAKFILKINYRRGVKAAWERKEENEKKDCVSDAGGCNGTWNDCMR